MTATETRPYMRKTLPTERTPLLVQSKVMLSALGQDENTTNYAEILSANQEQVARTVQNIECVACLDEFERHEVLGLKCGHYACRNCTQRMFTSYPARCCEEVSLDPNIARVLEKLQIERYIHERREKTAKSPLFCSRPDCGAFLPQERFFEDLAVCSACYGFTCTSCRNVAHRGEPCAADDMEKMICKMAGKKGWKACWRCRRLVSRSAGCDRMRCVCGATFCYKCGHQYDDCSCPWTFEDIFLLALVLGCAALVIYVLFWWIFLKPIEGVWLPN